MNTDNNKNILVKEFRWSHEQIELALRAKCKCEYCGIDLFSSCDSYILWEVDHIVPKSCGTHNFDFNDFNNLAISCSQCNWLKSKYNPLKSLKKFDREKCIIIAKNYINERRAKKQDELNSIIKIFDELFALENNKKTSIENI